MSEDFLSIIKNLDQEYNIEQIINGDSIQNLSYRRNNPYLLTMINGLDHSLLEQAILDTDAPLYLSGDQLMIDHNKHTVTGYFEYSPKFGKYNNQESKTRYSPMFEPFFDLGEFWKRYRELEENYYASLS